jgi:hypothetical protein
MTPLLFSLPSTSYGWTLVVMLVGATIPVWLTWHRPWWLIGRALSPFPYLIAIGSPLALASLSSYHCHRCSFLRRPHSVSPLPLSLIGYSLRFPLITPIFPLCSQPFSSDRPHHRRCPYPPLSLPSMTTTFQPLTVLSIVVVSFPG